MTKTSNIEQYQTEAEALATSIVELVPAGADVWWQVAQAINTPEGVENGAEAAGEAITQGLEADGWESKQLDRSDAQRAVIGFKRDDAEGGNWYVELRYRLGETGRGVDFLVVSPPTDAP